MFKIGCHLSISEGYYQAAKKIIELGGNTFQYFSRNPRGGSVKAWNQKDFNDYIEFSKNNGINQILTHAPYTLNLATDNPSLKKFIFNSMKYDLEILDNFPNALYNVHPGNYVKLTLTEGIDLIVNMLNSVIKPNQKSKILLETMGGKGTEIGRTFEELAEIISRIKYKDKIGVCLDTCHVYSAGYNIVDDLDGVISKFDEIIGLNYLMAVHLNDSLTSYNSNKDRHSKIGEGTIGLNAIINIINHPKLKDLPFYLETPNDDQGYAQEINLLKKLRKDE